jgi:hypothetical protein
MQTCRTAECSNACRIKLQAKLQPAIHVRCSRGVDSSECQRGIHHLFAAADILGSPWGHLGVTLVSPLSSSPAGVPFLLARARTPSPRSSLGRHCRGRKVGQAMRSFQSCGVCSAADCGVYAAASSPVCPRSSWWKRGNACLIPQQLPTGEVRAVAARPVRLSVLVVTWRVKNDNSSYCKDLGQTAQLYL